MFYILP